MIWNDNMIKGIDMTIEEKARDFAGYNIPCPQGSVTTPIFAAAMMGDRYAGFKAGAVWMLERALEFIREQYPGQEELAEEKCQLFKGLMGD